jgi:hypothetical protein
MSCMEYSKYEPGSVGYLIHCLHQYGHYDLAEDSKFGSGDIKYRGEVLASIGEKDGLPYLYFRTPCDPNLYDAASLRYQQFLKRPYLHNYTVLFQLEYVVQEIRGCLTFNEALGIKHVVEKLEGKIETLIPYEDMMIKIKRVMYEASHNHLAPYVEDIWQHLAIASAYSIVDEAKLFNLSFPVVAERNRETLV